jgi:hypothetical protein
VRDQLSVLSLRSHRSDLTDAVSLPRVSDVGAGELLQVRRYCRIGYVI